MTPKLIYANDSEIETERNRSNSVFLNVQQTERKNCCQSVTIVNSLQRIPAQLFLQLPEQQIQPVVPANGLDDDPEPVLCTS